MPREYDVTALKPFDYHGRSVEKGESFRLGLIDVLKLAHQRKIKLEQPISQPIVKKRGRRKKAETCSSSV